MTLINSSVSTAFWNNPNALLPSPFHVSTLIGWRELNIMRFNPGSLKGAPSENLTAVL